ncbi:MAG: hypothetical protein Q7T11_03795 [Deltaproteobacteria bacterium]|nr:hypothetical protein [Deltaproteobacteria bacterium]
MTKSPKSISWADLAKKVVYAGIGGASMAKSAITDKSFQKDLIGGLLNKAEQRKEELMEILAREVSKFLGKINVSQELTKALKGLVINFHASIDFKEKKGKIHSASARKEI